MIENVKMRMARKQGGRASEKARKRAVRASFWGKPPTQSRGGVCFFGGMHIARGVVGVLFLWCFERLCYHF